MHISESTVKRPVLAAVLSLFVILIGLASYDKLTIREYPDIDRPVVTVTTVYVVCARHGQAKREPLTKATLWCFHRPLQRTYLFSEE